MIERRLRYRARLGKNFNGGFFLKKKGVRVRGGVVE
jgi:hypothetical protein